MSDGLKPRRPSIPRLIHQIYWNFSNPSLSIPRVEWERNSETFRHKNPNWVYKRWNKQDAEALIGSNEYRWLLPVWNAVSPIEQTDVLRYVIMHKYGGFYADMDYICVKALDPLCDMGVSIILFNVASSLIVNTNPIASVPNHPFWLTLLRSLSVSPLVNVLPNYFKVMLTTGPLKLSKHRWAYPNQEEIHVFPHKNLEPDNRLAPNTFMTDSADTTSTWINQPDRWKAGGFLLSLIVIIVLAFRLNEHIGVIILLGLVAFAWSI